MPKNIGYTEKMLIRDWWIILLNTNVMTMVFGYNYVGLKIVFNRITRNVDRNKETGKTEIE